MIVVDASVAVKWLIPEPGTRAALAMLDQEDTLIAPALIRFEVTSGILRAYRKNGLTETRAKELRDTWEAMWSNGIIEAVSDAELLEGAVRLAFHTRHALFDCLYLAVAEAYDCVLVTADKPFHERTVKSFERITFLTLDN